MRQTLTLRQLRRRRGLSQQILAKQAGIHQSAVSDIEGPVDLNCKINTLRRVLLGMNIDLVLIAVLPEGKEITIDCHKISNIRL